MNRDRIKAICFDLDGTIMDTDDYWVEILSNIIRPITFLFPRFDPQKMSRRIVMAADNPVNAVFTILDRFNLDDKAIDLLNATRKVFPRKKNPGRIHLVSGIIECLQVLSKRYPLALVTTRDEKSARIFLEEIGVLSLFSAVVGLNTCHHTKPFPDPVVLAAQRMGFSPSDCVMVGDTVVDINAGRRAGAMTIGVLCGFGDERELSKAGADVLLPSTSDLAELFSVSPIPSSP